MHRGMHIQPKMHVRIYLWLICASGVVVLPCSRSPAELLAHLWRYIESVPVEERKDIPIGTSWHFLCPAAARAYFALIPMQQEVSCTRLRLSENSISRQAYSLALLPRLSLLTCQHLMACSNGCAASSCAPCRALSMVGRAVCAGGPDGCRHHLLPDHGWWRPVL
jgi:hypothetical protein